jgi:hypothetical protein
MRLHASGTGLEFTSVANPVQVSLSIGDYVGLTKVKANIDKAVHAAAN